MSVTVRRLSPCEDAPFCIEIQGHWPDATSMLAHLERLPTLRVLAKSEWRLTDDVWVDFEFRGYLFRMESPFSYLWIAAASPDVPEPVFRELEAHVVNYRRVGLLTRWKSAWRYFRLPKPAAPQPHTAKRG